MPKKAKKDDFYYVNRDQDVIATTPMEDGQMDIAKFKADFATNKPAEGANTYVASGTKEGQRPERGRGYKKGGKVKESKARGIAKDKAPVKRYAKGGGVESRGKTRGRFV